MLLHHDFHDCRMEAFGGVHRRGAALDIVQLRPLVDDDQRAFELPHALGIDAEIGLQREFNFHPLGHIDKRAARPDGRIEGGKLVVRRGDDRAEVLTQQIGVLADGSVCISEDHALLGQILLQRSIHHLAFKLRLHAGEIFPLSFGDAQPVECLFDLLRHVVPCLALLLGRLEVIEDVLKIDGDVAAPVGHRLGIEDLQRLQPEIAHPSRLPLHLGDLRDDLGIDAPPGLEDGGGIGAEVIFIDLAERQCARLIARLADR